MKILELCCGVGGWSKPWIEAGHDCVGVDIVDLGYPGKFIKADLFDWEPKENYDIVLASPPCSEFSVAKRNGKYTFDERIGLDLVWRVFYLIQKIKPKYWILENVKGLSEFIGPPKDIVRYRRAKNGKAAYLYGEFPEIGFMDEQIIFKVGWHSETGWDPRVRARRGEIPKPLAKQIMKVMT